MGNQPLRRPGRVDDAALSERQQEVIARVASGASLKVIALELALTVSTVAYHLAQAERRLGMRRWQLSRLASPTAELAVASQFGGHELRRLAQLTTSEREVIEHVLRGWSNQRIATARARSSRTIANQLASAYRKLEVASRSELYARYGALPNADAAEATRPLGSARGDPSVARAIVLEAVGMQL